MTTPTVFLPPDHPKRNKHHTEPARETPYTLEMDGLDKHGNHHPDYAAYCVEMDRQADRAEVGLKGFDMEHPF